MILRLVLRSIGFAPGRSALVLGGYALGVGVMVALLSIGDAMVEQSRDRDLVGGGDLAVLPAGIDLETLRTGGVSSLYFRVDLARFYHRSVLTGPRLAGAVEAAAPWIDDELLYARIGDSVHAVSAGGQIPSTAVALGVAPRVLSGEWTDLAADARWLAPTAAELRREVDAFHAPPATASSDSAWAEWHYFNVLSPDGERWLYLTFLIGGDLAGDAWGGQLLGTLVGPSGERAFRRDVSADRVAFRPGDVAVTIAETSQVRLTDDGVYRVNAALPAETGTGRLEVELEIVPDPHRYLPALDISPGDFPSGYAVPVLRGAASARICVDGRCDEWSGARAYHDHNWGVWRDVTWDWGQFQLDDWSIVYGGIARDTAAGGPASRPGSRFLFALDDEGLAAVLPVLEIAYRSVGGRPREMTLVAGRGDDRLRLEATATHVRSTAGDPRGRSVSTFYQLRGPARFEARLAGRTLRAEGDGFFETWVRE